MDQITEKSFCIYMSIWKGGSFLSLKTYVAGLIGSGNFHNAQPVTLNVQRQGFISREKGK